MCRILDMLNQDLGVREPILALARDVRGRDRGEDRWSILIAVVSRFVGQIEPSIRLNPYAFHTSLPYIFCALNRPCLRSKRDEKQIDEWGAVTT